MIHLQGDDRGSPRGRFAFQHDRGLRGPLKVVCPNPDGVG